mmetsp:Transcript_23109/g.57463  ORF Transcript_23109/g.57463 Transcript_23109/m.57463 type:complete len:1121 (-) Transcript_23109:204-3566(-)
MCTIYGICLSRGSLPFTCPSAVRGMSERRPSIAAFLRNAEENLALLSGSGDGTAGPIMTQRRRQQQSQAASADDFGVDKEPGDGAAGVAGIAGAKLHIGSVGFPNQLRRAELDQVETERRRLFGTEDGEFSGGQSASAATAAELSAQNPARASTSMISATNRRRAVVGQHSGDVDNTRPSEPWRQRHRLEEGEKEAREQLDLQARTMLGLDRRVRGFDSRLQALEEAVSSAADLAAASSQCSRDGVEAATAVASAVRLETEARCADMEKRLERLSLNSGGSGEQFQQQLADLGQSLRQEILDTQRHLEDLRRELLGHRQQEPESLQKISTPVASLPSASASSLGREGLAEELRRDIIDIQQRLMDDLRERGARGDNAAHVERSTAATPGRTSPAAMVAELLGPVSELIERRLQAAEASFRQAIDASEARLGCAVKQEVSRLIEERFARQPPSVASSQPAMAKGHAGGSGGLRQMADVIEELEARVQGEERVYWTVVQALEERVGDLEEFADLWRGGLAAGGASSGAGSEKVEPAIAEASSIAAVGKGGVGASPRVATGIQQHGGRQLASSPSPLAVAQDPAALLRRPRPARTSGGVRQRCAAIVAPSTRPSGTRVLLEFAEYARRMDHGSLPPAGDPFDSTAPDGADASSGALLLDAGFCSDDLVLPPASGAEPQPLPIDEPRTSSCVGLHAAWDASPAKPHRDVPPPPPLACDDEVHPSNSSGKRSSFLKPLAPLPGTRVQEEQPITACGSKQSVPGQLDVDDFKTAALRRGAQEEVAARGAAQQVSAEEFSLHENSACSLGPSSLGESSSPIGGLATNPTDDDDDADSLANASVALGLKGSAPHLSVIPHGCAADGSRNIASGARRGSTQVGRTASALRAADEALLTSLRRGGSTVSAAESHQNCWDSPSDSTRKRTSLASSGSRAARHVSAEGVASNARRQSSAVVPGFSTDTARRRSSALLRDSHTDTATSADNARRRSSAQPRSSMTKPMARRSSTTLGVRRSVVASASIPSTASRASMSSSQLALAATAGSVGAVASQASSRRTLGSVSEDDAFEGDDFEEEDEEEFWEDEEEEEELEEAEEEVAVEAEAEEDNDGGSSAAVQAILDNLDDLLP